MPGYKPGKTQYYFDEIIQYQMQQYIKTSKDNRIHCILFFLSGPRIKEDDWRLLKGLSEQFNLIPIIAKSDQYTTAEIKEIKESYRNLIRSEKIATFNIKSTIDVRIGNKG